MSKNKKGKTPTAPTETAAQKKARKADEAAQKKAEATERLEQIHQDIIAQMRKLEAMRNGQSVDEGLRKFFLTDVRTAFNRATGKAFGTKSLMERFKKKQASKKKASA